ncbi:MAG TPA: metallophosphoesterase [Micromonosporaceae bacterium]|nr:metallophosphoesterase [Micromonosporaceae bacterium]
MDAGGNEEKTSGGGQPSVRRRWLRGLPTGARLRTKAEAVRTSRPIRRVALGLSLLGVAIAGVIIGVLLGGRVPADIGPFAGEVAITPSVSGYTTVGIPPLGALHLDSHDGPAHLSVQLGSLDQRRTAALINDPAGISRASETALKDVTDGVIRVGLRTVAVCVLATLALAALVFRNTRRVAWSGTLALAISAGSLGVAALTLRPQSIEEPRYEGLLVNAPAVVGDARRIANDYNKYAEQLQRLVGNVSQIFTTVSTLPVYEPAEGTTRVLHISDMHLNPAAWKVVRTIVEQFKIDVVVDTGDITDWGSEPEASYLGSIGLLGVPYVYIRGNHDSTATAAAVDRQPNTIVLENATTTVAGLTFAGIGDPRFTPDKDIPPAKPGFNQPTADQLISTGETLADTVRTSPQPVNIAMVHDPASSGPLSGLAPIVLSGHTHKREVRTLPRQADGKPTLLMVEGSTGGAGLRGLEGEHPLPLSMSVLYFDQDRVLQAYDDIQVGGTGQAQVNLERHVLKDENQPEPTPTLTR